MAVLQDLLELWPVGFFPSGSCDCKGVVVCFVISD